MKVKVINIEKVEGIRKGNASDGTIRIIKSIYESKNMAVHLATFPPGNSSTKHVHPESEEICLVIKGNGEVIADGETAKFSANTLVYIPAGVSHQYKSLGDDEMVLFVVYSPPTELPR